MNTNTNPDRVLFQSPFLYLQAAGSDCSDSSARGVHLRWQLTGKLGENHLPKGNLAAPGTQYATTIGYNRENDFVKLLKTAYERDYSVDLYFDKTVPDEIIEEGQTRKWIYKGISVNDSPGLLTTVEVRFTDVMLYDEVRRNPEADRPNFFLAMYKGVMEVEPDNQLFFKTLIYANARPNEHSAYLEFEAIAVPDQKQIDRRYIACRQRTPIEGHADSGNDEDAPWTMCENMKYIRINCANADIFMVRFVTYKNTFLGYLNHWSQLDEFSLTDDDYEAYSRLGDSDIDKQWPRYIRSDPETVASTVSVDNYRKKWRDREGGIKQAVEDYLKLSMDDPKAKQVVESAEDDDKSRIEVSYLDALNIISTDFHIARMLGLGYIDKQDPDRFKEQNIYCVMYQTLGDLGDDLPDDSRIHISLSLPTRQTDYRYPPVPALSEISYGLHFGANSDEPSINLPDGYTPGGRERFVNINMNKFPHHEYSESFFASQNLFCLGNQSLPLQYGLKYRVDNDTSWRSPYILQDFSYFDPSGLPEVLPIVDQNNSNPIFTHRQNQEGTFHYTLYSINWFSRASQLSNEVSATPTTLDTMPPIPPLNLMAHFIQKENQLILTTASEQEMLEAITDSDKSLARVTFDWNHVHNDACQFADEIEFFMRRDLAYVVRGMVIGIEGGHRNKVLVHTREYVVSSVNPAETVRPILPSQLVDSFKGGVFAYDQEIFEIEHVQTNNSNGNNPSFLLKNNLERIATTDGNDEILITENYAFPEHGKIFTANQNLSETEQWDSRLQKTVKLEKFFPLQLSGCSNTRNNKLFTVLNVIKNGENTEIIVKENIASASGINLGAISYSKYIKYTNIIYSHNAILFNENLRDDISVNNAVSLIAAGGNTGQYNVENVTFGDHFTHLKLNRPLNDPSAKAGVLVINKVRNVDSLDHTNRKIIIDGIDLTGELVPAHREFCLVDGGTNVHEFILGGIFDTAIVHNITDNDGQETGAYKVTLNSFILTAPLDNDCSWYKGSIRIEEDPGFFPGVDSNDYRKPEIKVLQVYSLDINGPITELVVYDNTFNAQSERRNPKQDYMPIRTGDNVPVNYHPGYRVYLTRENANSLGNNIFCSNELLPNQGEGSRQRLLAARSKDSRTGKESGLTPPVVIFAQEMIIPEPPGEPEGPDFATRPDVYGKSTYTFDIEMNTDGGRQPYAIVCYRADIEKILRTLYKSETVEVIINDLKMLETDDPDDAAFFNNRFKDLVNVYLDDDDDTQFKQYLENGDGYRFPLPDNDKYIIPNPDPAIINKPFENVNRLGDEFEVTIFIKNGERITYSVEMSVIIRDAIENAFLSLTEQPILFSYLKEYEEVRPVKTSPAKPRMRNDNGDLLLPNDPGFDPFPMAVKYTDNGNRFVRFTDYTLDGAADTCYFYFAVEMNNKLEVSKRGPITGPISLLNTMPAEAPNIKEIISEPAAHENGKGPQVKIKINKYVDSEKIKKIRLYRATDYAKAASVRTMINAGECPVNDEYEIIDDFSDLGNNLPYAEPLYYRVVALREIINERNESEYVPSKPSEISLTNIIDIVNPTAPEISYGFDNEASNANEIKGVKLSWPKKVHNGKYHLYKLGDKGNWKKIHEIKDNADEISVDLQDTLLGTNDLAKLTDDNKPKYHYFKVMVENSSNLLSRNERILRIPDN